MHWLLHDANTPSVLDEAGYAYDSTVGYNETIGYRAGTEPGVSAAGRADAARTADAHSGWRAVLSRSGSTCPSQKRTRAATR